jgi:hypothetical protein
MLSAASHGGYSRAELDRLLRYGLTDQEISIVASVMKAFHCPDTCGRHRYCLDALTLAAQGGDSLAVKLLTTSHCDRMMDQAALAYGRALGSPCPQHASEEEDETQPQRQAR